MSIGKWILRMMILGGLVLTSCNDDIQVAAEWQELPIVYAFIDANSSQQIFRIQKAFLDQDRGATPYLGVSDSLYFNENLEIIISNPKTGKSASGRRVDAKDLNITKDNGLYVSDPHYLYEFNTSADFFEDTEEGIVRLDMTLPKGEIVEAETRAPEGVRLAFPSEFTTRPSGQVDMASKVARIGLSSSSKYVSLADFSYRMYIKETRSGNSDTISIPIELANLTPDFTRFEYENLIVYQQIVDQLEKNPEIERQVLWVDVMARCYGEELLTLQDLEAANSGLTASQDLPVFSNLSSGVGYFSGAFTLISEGHPLTESSLEIFKEADIFSGYGF